MRGTSAGGRIKSELDAQHVAEMWMSACIGENPGVIYLSIAERLEIDEERAKDIVKNWRELFGTGINPRDDKTDRADFIRRRTTELLDKAKGISKISDSDYEQRKKDVDNTNSNLEKECFRSQFRRELRRDRSSPEEIKLGLDFIETFRRSYLEFAAKSREEKTSRIQFLSILGTLILGVIALLQIFMLLWKRIDLNTKILV